MQKAMDETYRRRDKQQAFNKKYSIIPKGVVKPIVDILDTDLSARNTSEDEFEMMPVQLSRKHFHLTEQKQDLQKS